ncbi:MAG: hypothetical protein JSW28_05520 [Thermoplasmata archaeon]|nr:MAG: hypothetical protein JSW28_05520 [Thermoplasmata archaeon]
MAILDNIVNWFTKPKNMKGIVAMIVIVIILALDFAYWAGAIDVASFSPDSDGEDEGPDEEIPDDYDSGIISDSLAHGRKMYAFQQLMDDPRGEGEGETYNLYPVPVESNTSEVQIVSDGDGGRPRIDGGDRNDVDLYLYSPEKDAGGDFESTDPDYEGASASIQEAISAKRLEPGNWTLRVDCYTGEDVQYTIQIQIFYGGNETEEEP